MASGQDFARIVEVRRRVLQTEPRSGPVKARGATRASIGYPAPMRLRTAPPERLRAPRLRTPKQRAGDAAEEAACALLERAGCRVAARQVSFRDGEIDIVAWDGAVLVFVEVRLRSSARFGGAAASIDWRKQRRIVRAARRYLAQHFPEARRAPACRFDVVAVDGARVDWLRAAFDGA
jgi:putative endonuclease